MWPLQGMHLCEMERKAFHNSVHDRQQHCGKKIHEHAKQAGFNTDNLSAELLIDWEIKTRIL
jgi:hypothetical protein